MSLMVVMNRKIITQPLLYLIALNIVAIWVFYSCGHSGKKKDNPSTSDAITNNSSVMRGNTINTNYLLNFIDTNKVFDDIPGLIKYKNDISDSLYQYTTHLIAKGKNSPELEFLTDSLIYLNEKFSDILMKKYIQRAEKNILTFRCLKAMVNSAAISNSEKMGLFNLFPSNLQKGIEGQYILKRIKENDANIGIYIAEFYNSELLKWNNTRTTLKEIIYSPQYNYHLFILGASWCKPCRYANKILKNNIQLIDTSKIKIIEFSVDADIGMWKESVINDVPPWESFLLKKGFQSKMAVELKIKSIPRFILIDKSGKIIFEHFNIEFMINKLLEINKPISESRGSVNQLEYMQGELSRAEMKNIMAGDAPGGGGQICSVTASPGYHVEFPGTCTGMTQSECQTACDNWCTSAHHCESCSCS